MLQRGTPALGRTDNDLISHAGNSGRKPARVRGAWCWSRTIFHAGSRSTVLVGLDGFWSGGTLRGIIRNGKPGSRHMATVPPNRRMETRLAFREGSPAHHRKEEASYKEDREFSTMESVSTSGSTASSQARSLEDPSITSDHIVFRTPALIDEAQKSVDTPTARWANSNRKQRDYLESKLFQRTHARHAPSVASLASGVPARMKPCPAPS